MLVQQEVTLNDVMAWVGWALAIIAAAASIIFPGHGLVGLVVLLTGAAAALHARGFVHRLECHGRNAFELGRDSERGVRALR